MPHYVLLVNYDPDVKRKIREFPKGRDRVNRWIQDRGGKVTRYFTQGPHDVVAIVELPDDETMMQLSVFLGGLGGIRTTTTRAFTEEEFLGLLKDVPEE